MASSNNNEIISQVSPHTIKKFELMNDSKSHETYKWLIAKSFRPMVDEALGADDTDFPGMLLKVQKLTGNLTDSYTQPFYGLYEFAKREPSAVKMLLNDLFASNPLPPVEKMQEIRKSLAGDPSAVAAAEPGAHSGFGLRNVDMRIRLYYHKQKGLLLKSGPSGTEVSFVIPVRTREEIE